MVICRNLSYLFWLVITCCFIVFVLLRVCFGTIFFTIFFSGFKFFYIFCFNMFVFIGIMTQFFSYASLIYYIILCYFIFLVDRRYRMMMMMIIIVWRAIYGEPVRPSSETKLKLNIVSPRKPVTCTLRVFNLLFFIY